MKPIESEILLPRGEHAFIVASPSSVLQRRGVDRLAEYIRRTCSGRVGSAHQGITENKGDVRWAEPTLPVVRVVGSIDEVPEGEPAVVLCGAELAVEFEPEFFSEHPEAFVLKTGEMAGRPAVVAAGKSDKGLKRAVQRLIILSRQTKDGLVIPPLDLSESPWMPEREWTQCPWDPVNVRGVFHNPNVDHRFRIHLYDRERLARYVEMLDWCGFSGCQLMQTCITYATLGSIEAAQDWIDEMTVLLEQNGQDASLWVWAAEFNGYGWVDPEGGYFARPDERAFEDPEIRKVFERHYDLYAEHSPRLKRLIAHYYDPGHLKNRKDVFDFARLLERKAKAKNPDIEMAIDTWGAGVDYFQTLVDQGFGEWMLVPVAIPTGYREGGREEMHRTAARLGLRLGYWGWYQTEYETDQLASMYVNARLLANFYRELRDGAFRERKPVYYSEMEAHHLNNLASMYAAGQLLWNPDRDPDEILEELTDAVWGPKNGPAVLDALMLIQDIRTGSEWGTYWWTDPKYRIGTEDPKEDLRRAEECIKKLSNMEPDEEYVTKIPLPYPPQELVELVLPHLEQIREYAKFRIAVEKIVAAAEMGKSKEDLQQMLAEAWEPVREYDTWVGVFGIPELREQRKILAVLRDEFEIEADDPAWLRYMESDRVLQYIRNMQRHRKEPLGMTLETATGQFFWPTEVRKDRFQRLIDEGLLTEAGEGKYQLADWENWAGE